MNNAELSVRELQPGDVDLITQYWLTSDKNFLEGMGVDVSKIPTKEEWIQMLTEQINTPIEKKKSYCIIWLINDKPVGHSNINKIVFGEEAYMHLHIWTDDARKQGHGMEFIRMTLPYFFNNMKLKKLYCEPYALNPAPNKILQKAGFEFVKEYLTTPGWINFEQPVKLWQLTYERFTKVHLT